MSAGKKFLIFFLGMITGIVLLVGSVVGAIYGVGSLVTVGEVQDGIIKAEIIDKESEMYNKTLFDALKQVIGDVTNPSNFSLQSLYQNYGIKLLNEIEGIDLSQKSFYATPLTQLLESPSQIIEAFTLDDITKLANINLEEIDFPILYDNLNVSVNKAVENILGSIDENLSIRSINTSFGIDLGVKDSAMLATLQDVALANFGSVINAVQLSTLLDIDTDVFVKSGLNTLYIKADTYQEVSSQDLTNVNYTTPLGVERYFDDASDTNNDGTTDTLDYKELRFVLKTNEDGTTQYIVDNSCYQEDFDPSTNEKTFYRHILYKEYTSGDTIGESDDLYVRGYYNHIESFSGEVFSLLDGGFVSLKDLFISDNLSIKTTYQDLIKQSPTPEWLVSGKVMLDDVFYIDNNDNTRIPTSLYSITDSDITKDSILNNVENTTRDEYLIVNVGTSKAILQNIAHLCVSELQNADDMLENLYVSDVIIVNEHSAKILRSLVDRNCTIGELGNIAGQLSLGEMIEIKTHDYVKDDNGLFVRIENDSCLVPYDDTLTSMQGLQRFNADGSENTNGKYVHSHYFTSYNPALHSYTQRYAIIKNPDADSKILQHFAFSKFEADSFDSLVLADVMDIETDTYVAVDMEYSIANKDVEDFYIFNADTGIYMRWDGSATTQTLYRIVKEGNNKAILKRIAFCSIDNLAQSMEDVISDMRVSDLIDVNVYSEIELDNNMNIPTDKNNTYYFFRPYGVDENERPYTYVYDIDGKFMLRNYILKPVVSGVATQTKAYFKYENITDIADFGECLLNFNVFYYSEKDNEYIHNIPLCSYLSTRGDFTHIYKRVTASQDEVGAVEADTYTEGSLYVNINGIYMPYTASDITHHALGEYYQYEAGNFFVPITQKGLSDEYEKQDNEVLFGMRYCDKVYILDNSGRYVYLNGKYVVFDENIHDSSIPRYREDMGYVGKYVEAYDHESTVFNSLITLEDGGDIITKVKTATKLQSVPILRYFAKQNTCVENMNDVLDSAHIGDIMDIEPNSMFSQFADCTLSTLSSTFASTLPTMTIGDILEWSSISKVDDNVIASLKSVSLENFLISLTATEHGIIVDMEIALGYKVK